jgi:hypothetical protein
MRRRITRALFAAAAAGATITSLSFAAAGPASAAQASTVLSTGAAGWAAGNVLAPTLARTSSTWRFRYVRGTTVLPNVSADANNTQEAFSVQLSNLKATFAAQMVSDATGAWSVQFLAYYQNGTAASTYTPAACNPASTPWTVGTPVRLDVYYNAGDGTITFTAYSGPDVICSATEPAWNANTMGGGALSEAYTGGVFNASTDGDPYTTAVSTTWARPTADTKLFAVSGARITSYNGTSGTVQGPWGYQELIFGTSSANDLADAPVLWNGGANFGVWQRA